MLPFILDRGTHWLFCADDLEDVDGSAEAANLSPLAILVSPYILFDSKYKRFFMQSQREQIFEPCEQLHHLLHGKGAVHNENDADSAV